MEHIVEEHHLHDGFDTDAAEPTPRRIRHAGVLNEVQNGRRVAHERLDEHPRALKVERAREVNLRHRLEVLSKGFEVRCLRAQVQLLLQPQRKVLHNLVV